MTETTAVVGVIMGSDSDWPTMRAAAEALAEFDVAYEVRVLSAHRTPEAMLDLRPRRRRPRPAGHHRRRRRRGPPARHGGQRDPAAGHRRAGAAASTSTGWTRCCRSCRCRPASRWPPSRSAAPATPGCSRCGSSPRPTPGCVAGWRRSRTSLRALVEEKDAALRAVSDADRGPPVRHRSRRSPARAALGRAASAACGRLAHQHHRSALVPCAGRVVGEHLGQQPSGLAGRRRRAARSRSRTPAPVAWSTETDRARRPACRTSAGGSGRRSASTRLRPASSGGTGATTAAAGRWTASGRGRYGRSSRSGVRRAGPRRHRQRARTAARPGPGHCRAIATCIVHGSRQPRPPAAGQWRQQRGPARPGSTCHRRTEAGAGSPPAPCPTSPRTTGRAVTERSANAFTRGQRGASPSDQVDRRPRRGRTGTPGATARRATGTQASVGAPCRGCGSGPGPARVTGSTVAGRPSPASHRSTR